MDGTAEEREKYDFLEAKCVFWPLTKDREMHFKRQIGEGRKLN